MNRNLFVLRNVSDFAPGAFENTAVEEGCIQLGQRGGEHLTRGSYTSPVFRMPPFTRLLAAWNVDTPRGTTVEVQARVAKDGKWSKWLAFGIWSPFVRRGSAEAEADEVASIEGDLLLIDKAVGSANTAQLRIQLHTEEAKATPRVHLLAAAVQPVELPEEKEITAQRTVELPAYACLVRDPSIGGHIASATTLAMLMNRWGEDVLPEEVARGMYDAVTGRFGNKAFVSAAAGMYGYECYPRFCGIDDLRTELRHGYALAAEVCYRAPALGEAEEGEEEAAPDGQPPVWEEATSDSHGHLVAVRGFATVNGQEVVELHDPYTPSDDSARKQVPLDTFRRLYTGLAFMLHKGPGNAGTAKPERKLTELVIEDDELRLSAHGELLQPGESIPGKASRATICYTLSDGVAYASAAQKKFYYLKPGADGHVPFDITSARGRRFTLYLIGTTGTTWVAEKLVPQTPDEKGQDAK